jgi:hypothetical protein
MKAKYIVLSVLFLILSWLGTSSAVFSEDLSLQAILKDSKDNQLCGKFAADSHIFKSLPPQQNLWVDSGWGRLPSE